MTDSAPHDRSRRLGRGLGALIAPPAAAPPVAPPGQERLRDIPVSQIRPNPLQPRKDFKEEELQELEASIRASGLLQPISVRSRAGGFELIAGERRFRAVKRLGWATIPAVVREIDDEELLTLALIENLQREDLNPMDEAEGYQRLAQEFGLSQQRIADAVGKDRSTVANLLRLLTLPDDVQHLVRNGQLTVGHARALLGLPPERSISETARYVVERELTVRDVERLAQRASGAPARSLRKRAAPDPGNLPLRHIEDRLRRRLQTDVRVSANEASAGELHIRFYSADDLERLLELIVGPPDEGY